jgi:hypothetical protein
MSITIPMPTAAHLCPPHQMRRRWMGAQQSRLQKALFYPPLDGRTSPLIGHGLAAVDEHVVQAAARLAECKFGDTMGEN